MDYNTRKLLNLTDKNISFEDAWLSYRQIKGKKAQVISGRLSSSYCKCPQCGFDKLVKNGTYKTITQLPEFNRRTTFIELKRERYLCRNCGSTVSAKTSLVDDYCNLSVDLKRQIAVDLKENRSRKDIAAFHDVSDTSVLRVLDEYTKNCRTTFQYLPEALSIDEFKSTRSCHNGMSFICADAESKEIIDILPDRRLQSLTKYFLKYSRKARLKVKFLIMDMNASYGELLKVVFPNAELITDRFHIIQHLNRNLNQLRINQMNRLSRYKSDTAKQYRRLKRYWKLLLKDSQTLNFEQFYYRPLFKKMMSETEIVTELLSYSSILQEGYNYIQNIKYAYSIKNYSLIMENIKDIPSTLPNAFKSKFKVFNKFRQGIKNALISPYSNGFIEGLNNKIKVIKRIAYGYRNFLNFKKRIYLIQGKSFKTK